MKFNSLFFVLIFVFFTSVVHAQRTIDKIDKDWRFAFGGAIGTNEDYGFSSAYFSYLAKAGFGDGPASSKFDDRSWQRIQLPHDWMTQLIFSPNASPSHGYKAGGKGFANHSIGWYRKNIFIPKADKGKIISIKFDGVFRNSKVWLNGFYLGNEESGYNSFNYDVTPYVNYGKENVLTVRVNATEEEGWFYEGAGIYRDVYLVKTNPIHIKDDGIFITPQLNKALTHSEVNIKNIITNDGASHQKITVENTLYDPNGTLLKNVDTIVAIGKVLSDISIPLSISVDNPQLWDTDNPLLYSLQTKIYDNNHVLLDSTSEHFGIRSIFMDPTKGFFLNGKHIKLKGTNNHQSHAGVGTALNEGMIYYRLQKLKAMGSNAYRGSHYPLSPVFLDACDRLGILVIEENRLMGINPMHLRNVRKMIERDYNHPSIFSWSIGNEEWMIEGNNKGVEIADYIQNYIQTLDSSRYMTAGLSNGFKVGMSSNIQVMGYNYLGNGDIQDHYEHHQLQPSMGTEEGSTFATRGIYKTDSLKQYESAYDRKPRPSFYSIEEGWYYYAKREYLSGVFFWTGFDYRGEPTPYSWPSVTSYFGMMDLCGFPKDDYYYLQSWWQSKPMLHILPHWNWVGSESKNIKVVTYSNLDEVELFLNGHSLGKKEMPINSHLYWNVPYQKGVLSAAGYRNGNIVLRDSVVTSGPVDHLDLQLENDSLSQSKGIYVVKVKALDKFGYFVPDAKNSFTIKNSSQYKILGVGNGDPTSHAPENYDTIYQQKVLNFRKLDSTLHFVINSFSANNSCIFTIYTDSSFKVKTIMLNGKMIHSKSTGIFEVSNELLKKENSIRIVSYDRNVKLGEQNSHTLRMIIQQKIKLKENQLSLFNGLAQIIIQSEQLPKLESVKTKNVFTLSIGDVK
ncbi:beta-galactosidase GalA [Rhizosphaericola mali]|uniref:Glycoside hydrolase family 2 protein n=1 Tax=Rhizosphaericola mali TaxID=2545455 RepID=A0A5P2G206_9BACT|nr:beta-galactosidase GalA [Rhizosphaericola mali]QES89834.1 glycoside hydrolase family 2 protein [Rhizosphaericola mali]